MAAAKIHICQYLTHAFIEVHGCMHGAQAVGLGERTWTSFLRRCSPFLGSPERLSSLYSFFMYRNKNTSEIYQARHLRQMLQEDRLYSLTVPCSIIISVLFALLCSCQSRLVIVDSPSIPIEPKRNETRSESRSAYSFLSI